MYFYYYLLIFILILYFLSNFSNVKDKKKLFLYLSFSLLIIVSGIRGYECGGDLQHYVRNYPIIGQQSVIEILESRIKYGYIFCLLYKIAYYISNSPTSLLIVTSMFSLIPIGYFIYKYSPSPLLSVFIYITFSLYTNTFNSVRASVALGVLVFAIKYIIKRDFWKFLLVFLVAFEIHQTTIFYLLLYPLYETKISFKLILLSVGVCFIVASISSNVLPFVASIASYYDSGSYEEIDTTLIGGYNLLLFMLGITLIMYYLLKKDLLILYKNRDSPQQIETKDLYRTEIIQFSMTSMILACCFLCFATLYTDLTRICIFFDYVIIIQIPITLLYLKNKGIRQIATITTIVFFLIYFNTHVMKPLPLFDGSNDQRTLPYKTYWEK